MAQRDRRAHGDAPAVRARARRDQRARVRRPARARAPGRRFRPRRACARSTSSAWCPNAADDRLRCAELRERGLRTALLTNNVREWEPLWRAKLPELDEIFEVVVDSAFVGLRKPDPRDLRADPRAPRRRLRAGECVFLDDLDVNCQAASALGMAAVRFEETGRAIEEIEAALSEP